MTAPKQIPQHPEGKVCEEDIPFLLAEYQRLQGWMQYSVNMAITFIFFLVAVMGIGVSLRGINPSFSFSSFMITPSLLIVGVVIYYVLWYIHLGRKTSKLAYDLKIKERLKKYGI